MISNFLQHTSIFALEPDDVLAAVIAAGEKKYRAKQILDWVYQKNITDFSEMTNLSKTARDKFAELFSLQLPQIAQQQSSIDGTRKYLLQLYDEQHIEMVLIPAADKMTLCISSQVGCKRACRFCATSRLGLMRSLNIEEIVGQVYLARQLAFPAKLTNIVFMGMGEPLDNLENVLKAVNIIKSNECLAISPRRITISTCGVVPGIMQLADSQVNVKLAVSLNAALDAKRDIIMPVNMIYPLSNLKSSLKYFSKHNPFRITFEYVMIKDFNINREDWKALRKFTGDISCKINLIPWNPIPHLEWESPAEEEVNSFITELNKVTGTAITLRNSRGQDIAAACGMLAGQKKASL